MLNLNKNLKKFLKKSVAVSLCSVMTIVAIPCLDVFADEINTNEVITNNQRDLYSEEFNETLQSIQFYILKSLMKLYRLKVLVIRIATITMKMEIEVFQS